MSSLAADSPTQPIAVTASAERTVVVVRPSLAAGRWGRWLGQRFEDPRGFSVGGVRLTVGWLLALATAPLTALMYLTQRAPRLPLVVVGWPNGRCVRYRLTNRRVVIEGPYGAAPVAERRLDEFDDVHVDTRPGQGWHHAGDLVLTSGGKEMLRLPGVQRPEPLRRLLLNTRHAFVGAAR